MEQIHEQVLPEIHEINLNKDEIQNTGEEEIDVEQLGLRAHVLIVEADHWKNYSNNKNQVRCQRPGRLSIRDQGYYQGLS